MAAFRVSRTWPFGPSTSGITIAKHSIVWLNQFIDTGARYDQFLCPAPRTSTDIGQYDSPTRAPSGEAPVPDPGIGTSVSLMPSSWPGPSWPELSWLWRRAPRCCA
ncbi:poly(ethylene terephthalate) hydrolase family protein [Glutamicibacter sp. TV12E]|uniref:poly(ethylene terephthalate) hydrolase family protein n=1 Tax=Glutamicibacter sp. TV12E TaxID=3446362 RepID=UPI00403439AB